MKEKGGRKMLLHWIWFASLPGVSTRQKLQLLERFSDPEEIFRTENFAHIPEISEELAELLSNKELTVARKIMTDCKHSQLGILTMQDAGYPSKLRCISDPPLVLYYKGYMPDFEEQPTIGVVGTRKATANGLNNARNMAREITVCGGVVVSGGAAGIDTAALQGALDMGGSCVAVLGCGADVVYPKSNTMLFRKISECGCILSEYPPGTEPRPWQFPERNRIISGLSNGVLVVEAPQNSGALITAREAFSQGRDVFAVPGNVGNPACEGSNALLEDCAAVALSGWGVMKEYEGVYPCVAKRTCLPPVPEQEPPMLVAQHPLDVPKTKGDKKAIDNSASGAYIDRERILQGLDPFSRKIVEKLSPDPIPVDDLIAMVEAPPNQVLGALTMLALSGVVENHPGRLVSLKH